MSADRMLERITADLEARRTPEDRAAEESATWENLGTMMREAMRAQHEAGYALARWVHIPAGGPREGEIWDAKIATAEAAKDATEAAWRCFYDAASVGK